MIDTTPSSRNQLVPPQQFSPQYPPPFGPVQGIPPALAAALPTIASVTANMLGKNSTISAVFCFLYNRVTMHGMRNHEWQKLLEAVTYHTWFNINEGKHPNEDAALQDAAKMVIIVYASFVAYNTPEMRQLLTIGQQQEVMQYAERWPVFTQAYTQLEAQSRTMASQQQATMMGGMGGFSQQASAVASGWGSPNTNRAATGAGGLGGFTPPASYVAPGDEIKPVAANNGGGYYDEPAQPVFKPVQTEIYIPGVSRGPAPKVEVPKTPPKASFLNHVTEIQSGRITHHDRVMNPIETATADQWVPTPYQPYHPAYRTGQEAFYEFQADHNGLKRVIAIVSTKETEMDQSKHNFTSAASMFSSLTFGDTPAEVKVSEALSQTAAAILSGEVGENSEATALYKALGVVNATPVEVPAQTSMRALLAEARGYRLICGFSEPTFVVSSGLSYQVVSKSSHQNLLKTLRTCSLEAGAKELKSVIEMIKNVGKAEDRGTLEFVLGLDRAIKQELLSVIRFRMGVGTDFSFDNFFEDEPDVRAALSSVYGISHQKAYHAVQAQLLPTMLDESVVEELVLNGATDEEPKGFSTVISPMVTLLLVDLSDEQLGFKLPDGAVCEVFSDTFPGLHEFISTVVQTNPGALHHYIATNDDVVYEVNVGLVGNGHMVMTRVPVGL